MVSRLLRERSLGKTMRYEALLDASSIHDEPILALASAISLSQHPLKEILTSRSDSP